MIFKISYMNLTHVCKLKHFSTCIYGDWTMCICYHGITVSTIVDLCFLFLFVSRIYDVDLWSMFAKVNVFKSFILFCPCASTSVFFEIRSLILLITILCDITFYIDISIFAWWNILLQYVYRIFRFLLSTYKNIAFDKNILPQIYNMLHICI